MTAIPQDHLICSKKGKAIHGMALDDKIWPDTEDFWRSQLSDLLARCKIPTLVWITICYHSAIWPHLFSSVLVPSCGTWSLLVGWWNYAHLPRHSHVCQAKGERGLLKTSYNPWARQLDYTVSITSDTHPRCKCQSASANPRNQEPV